jgi:natural product precursor
MTFQKLILDDFNQDALSENEMRSLRGGEITNCNENCPDLRDECGNTIYCDGISELDTARQGHSSGTALS